MNHIISWFVLILGFAIHNTHAGQVAIVIDDIGYKISDKKLLELSGQLTFAILPHTPLGHSYAKQASHNNRDVIIHLPMQANAHNELLGPGALTQSMSKQTYQQTLLSALEDIPFAVGVNNHMGSLLTQQERPMGWTMELLRQHNMFFLDSKTTVHSKVEKVAKQYGVSSLNRSVFLDHNRDPKQITRQFNRLIKLARKQGSAIAIGHPYPETYQVLKTQLARLEQEGITLVPISKLLTPPTTYPSLIAQKDQSDTIKNAKPATRITN